VSGSKTGVSVYNEYVQPMLEQAGIEPTLVVTKHANHAMEYMQNYDNNENNENNDNNNGIGVHSYDGIVSVGGDGLLSEIIRGIYKRPDAEEFLKTNTFGVVGAGTSNGLAKSITVEANEPYGVLESMFLICRGQTTKLDLSEYQLSDGSLFFAFLTFSWAFVADIEVGGEALRWLGRVRQDIVAVWRILFLRRYKGTLYYTNNSNNSNDNSGSTLTPVLPPLDQPPPDNCHKIEDTFIIFWPCQVSHPDTAAMASPNSKCNDGLFRIGVVRGLATRRSKLLSLFLEVEQGKHFENNSAEEVVCSSWRLVPDNDEDSANVVDGEVVPSGPIQAKVLPGKMRIFGCPKRA